MSRSVVLASALTWPTMLLAAGLSAQELSLDSVLAQPVSAAAKYAQTSAEAAASVTIITADDIRRYGYRTLVDVVRGVPGFYTSYDRNYYNLGVRGFGRPGDYTNRVLLLIDGHTINEGVFGSAGFGTDLALDPDVIERVEVVHGPASALYGTGAMLASINIVTRDGRGIDGVEVAFGAGSAGLRRAAVTAGTVLGEGTDLSVAFQVMDYDGADHHYAEYDSVGGGIATGLDWERNASGRAALSWRGLTVSAFASRRTKGIPTGAYGIDFNDPVARTRDERGFLEVRQRITLRPGAILHLRGHADRYEYAGVYPYGGESYTDLARDVVLGSEVRLQWDLAPSHRLLAGVEYKRHRESRYAYGAPDTSFYDRDAPFSVASAYLQDELQLWPSVGLVLGVRRDAHGEFRATTSPRAALVLHPAAGTTIKLLAGEAFRSPSPYEQFYEDAQSVFKISSGLGPERIRTLEATLDQRLSGSLQGSVGVYRYTMRDLVDTWLDPADSMLQFRNLAKTRARGVTLGLRVVTQRGLSGYFNYAYQQSEDATTSVELTNSPTHVLKAGVGSDASRRVALAAEARVESSRLTVQGTRTASYLWTAGHLRIRLGGLSILSTSGLWDEGEFSLAVTNALNVRYAEPGAFEHLQAAFAQDGRSITARLRLAW